MTDDRSILELACANNHGTKVSRLRNVMSVTLQQSTQEALTPCYEVPNQSFRHDWHDFCVI